METGYEEFWELVESERHNLWRLVRGLTRSYDEATDLMSDTWVAAYKSYPKLQNRGSFRAFVSTIAVRLHRRRRWRARIFVPLTEANESSYELSSESSHDLGVLLSALNRLPLREREAIVLFEITGLSLKEIQSIQGISLSGVKSRLARARRDLRKMVAEVKLDETEGSQLPEIFDVARIRFQQQ